MPYLWVPTVSLGHPVCFREHTAAAGRVSGFEMLQALVKNETERALLQEVLQQGGAVGAGLQQLQEMLQLHHTFKSLWSQLLVCRRSNLMSLLPLVSKRLEQLPAAAASLATALPAQLVRLQPLVDRLAVFASAHRSTAEELQEAEGTAAALAAEKSALAQVESHVVDSLTQLAATSRKHIQEATEAAAAAAAFTNSTQPLQQQQQEQQQQEQQQQPAAQQGLQGPSASRGLQQEQLQLQQQQQALQRLLQALWADSQQQQQQQPSNAAARPLQTSPAAGAHVAVSAPPSSTTQQGAQQPKQQPKQRRQQEQQQELHRQGRGHLQSIKHTPAQQDQAQQLPDAKRRRFGESSEPQHFSLRTATIHVRQPWTLQMRPAAHGLPGPLTAGLPAARSGSSAQQQLDGKQEQRQQQQQQQQQDFHRQVLAGVWGKPSSVQALGEPQRPASLPALAASQQQQQQQQQRWHPYPDCSALEQTVLAVAGAVAKSSSSLQGATSSQPHPQNFQQQPEDASQQGPRAQVSAAAAVGAAAAVVQALKGSSPLKGHSLDVQNHHHHHPQRQQPADGSQQGPRSQQQQQEQQSVEHERAPSSQEQEQQQSRRLSEGSGPSKGHSLELLAAVKAKLCEGDPALGADSQPGSVAAVESVEGPVTNPTERLGSGTAMHPLVPQQAALAAAGDDRSSPASSSGAQQAPPLMVQSDGAGVPAGDA